MFTSYSAPAAFLDILAPPYDPDHVSNQVWYNELELKNWIFKQGIGIAEKSQEGITGVVM